MGKNKLSLNFSSFTNYRSLISTRSTMEFLVNTSVLLGLTVPIAVFSQCPPSGGGTFEGSLTITSACVVTGDLTLDKNNLTINTTGSLTITGFFKNNGDGTVLLNGGALSTTDYFDNNGNGTVTVTNGGTLDVGSYYFNNGNGTTNFSDGSVTIGGDYTNNGNGSISAGGVVSVAGNFTVDGDGTTTVSGGLSVGGTATLKKGGIDIENGGVFQANSVTITDSDGSVDIQSGGTLFVTSGSVSGTVNNDASNTDQDCSNNCCGELCNASGNDLNGEAAEVLPVVLHELSAIQVERNVLISWSTASELNNDRFVLERSHDGQVWELVEIVKGAGTVETRSTYQITDTPDSYGLIYYRLTQVDFDGQFEVFRLVSVFFEPIAGIELTVYPTVLSHGESIKINTNLGEINSIDLQLITLSGQQHTSIPIVLTGKDLSFSLPPVSAGIYLVQGQINGGTVNQRIVIR